MLKATKRENRRYVEMEADRGRAEVDRLYESGQITPEEYAELNDLLQEVEKNENRVNRKGRNKWMDDFERSMHRLDVRIDQIDEAIGDAMFGEEGSSTDASSTGGSSGPPKASRASSGPGGSSIESIMTDGDALLHLQETNPERFAEQFRELESVDKQVVMTNLQQAMAANNELTQVMTSMIKARHETAMAIARNLTV